MVDSVHDTTHTLDQLRATVLNDRVVEQVSTTKPYPNPGEKRNVVLVDYGLKHSILRELSKRDFQYDRAALQVQQPKIS